MGYMAFSGNIVLDPQSGKQFQETSSFGAIILTLPAIAAAIAARRRTGVGSYRRRGRR